MTKILKYLFIFSLLVYLGSTAYTRVKNKGKTIFPSDFFYSFPLDAFPLKYIDGKDEVSIQIGVLSASEVAVLLKTNPDVFPNIEAGAYLKPLTNSSNDYVVLRFKDKGLAKWGDIKCYYSCFSHPIVEGISLPTYMENYYNIILPYPESVEKNEPCAITVEWKNFWGHP